ALLSVTEYKRLSSLFLILAGATLMRFVFGFVSHVSLVIPVGTVWMFAWGTLIYWFYVTERARDETRSQQPKAK
ncbi:MAG: hypothetical protein SV377_05540, partial [Halobacteria archaeon]|nr:hypothetical protein [Halobacteria archaeon]